MSVQNFNSCGASGMDHDQRIICLKSLFIINFLHFNKKILGVIILEVIPF